jgi:hypothetical protein
MEILILFAARVAAVPRRSEAGAVLISHRRRRRLARARVDRAIRPPVPRGETPARRPRAVLASLSDHFTAIGAPDARGRHGGTASVLTSGELVMELRGKRKEQ